MSLRLAAGSMMALLAAPAFAADNGFYVGGGLTRSGIDTGGGLVEEVTGGFSINDRDNGYKLIAGVRPINWFAVELNYIDFGRVEASSPVAGLEARYDLQAASAFALGFYSLPFFDFYGKLGLVRWDSDAAVATAFTGQDIRASDSGTDFAYGAGAQVRFGSLGARLEYERFNVDGTDRVSAITLGVTWTFL